MNIRNKKASIKEASNLLSRWQDSNLRPLASKVGWISYSNNGAISL